VPSLTGLFFLKGQLKDLQRKKKKTKQKTNETVIGIEQTDHRKGVSENCSMTFSELQGSGAIDLTD
jgi:hypothetical protein